MTACEVGRKKHTYRWGKSLKVIWWSQGQAQGPGPLPWHHTPPRKTYLGLQLSKLSWFHYTSNAVSLASGCSVSRGLCASWERPQHGYVLNQPDRSWLHGQGGHHLHHQTPTMHNQPSAPPAVRQQGAQLDNFWFSLKWVVSSGRMLRDIPHPWQQNEKWSLTLVWFKVNIRLTHGCSRWNLMPDGVVLGR